MKFLFLGTHSNETLFENTHLVCLTKGVEVVRINIEDFLPNTTNNVRVGIKKNDVLFFLNDKEYYLSEFSVLWKRRISDNFLSAERVLGCYENQITTTLNRKLIKEVYELRDLILNIARKINLKIINDFDLACLSKPFQTITAMDFGLNCPSMLVSNSLESINNFITHSNNNSITKPLGGLGYFYEGKHVMSIKTTRLDLSYTDSVSKKTIFPSLVQGYIESRYELKCILVGEELYCVKQFSQEGNIPTTDIKEAYKKNLIRNEEYELNSAVKEKIVRLCKFFKLDLCTIDIIKGTNNEYTFIEINPDGLIEYYASFLNSSIYKRIFSVLLEKSY